MEFKACKFLSFDHDKYSCELVRIGNHLGWERRNPDGQIELCEQCTKCGRINDPCGCIGKKNAWCSDYVETEISFKE